MNALPVVPVLSNWTPAGHPVTWTFVTGTSSGIQTHIGANLDATLTARRVRVPV